MPALIDAIQWDGVEDADHPLPRGAHGEVDKFDGTGRRFVCVAANGLCIEIEPGWWIAYAPDGHSYPIPSEFVDDTPRYTKAEVEAAVLPFVAEAADWVERPDAAEWMAEIMARLDAARANSQ